MSNARRTAGLALVLAGALGGLTAVAADWPHFRGPKGDGICEEKGLLQEWPEGGPKLLWKLEGLGRGYSSVSIAGGKLYTMGDLNRDGQESQFILAYDLNTKQPLWQTRVGPPHGDGGPRCTPTVSDGLVYAIGTSGDLVCADAATGKKVWDKSFEKDFGGQMMSGWKFSESPLVDGERLVCTPGGAQATMVALNRKTGEVIWKCAMPNIGDRGKDGAGYSSCVISEACGIRQYVQILGRGAIGVAADTGKFLWGYNRVANNVANITTPVVKGDYVFVSTAYGTGSGLVKLVKEGDGLKAEQVYFLGPEVFQNHHGGVVLLGDCLYGGDGQNKGGPTCIEFLTGKIVWHEKSLSGGSAAVLAADGRLIYRYDSGTVCLLEAKPDGLHVKGRFDPVKGAGPAWPHPVILDGKLYLRHGDILACYDVKTP